MAIDYSLYLVTGRDLLPQGVTYLQSLEQSLQGGVTVVQVREKNADTGEFLEIAQQTKTLCVKYKVPLIINDRIDIALAVHADGVHLGQSDMPVHMARKLLPPDAVIGISCNTADHVMKAVEDGADYVGIGAIHPTTTKQLTKPIVTVRGVGEMIDVLKGTKVKAVGIGGIKSDNVIRTLYGSVSSSGRCLDGVAVVSDIVASTTPLAAAKTLKTLTLNFKLSRKYFSLHDSYTPDLIRAKVGEALNAVRTLSPLVHQITNTVVSTQSANATLALGASPIMAVASEEMEDLAHAPGGLLINFGTVQDIEGMYIAGYHANLNRKPIVFDPVGVGATTFRCSTANDLLNTWQAAVIKGNAAEIGALSKSSEVQSKGVDSTGAGFSDPAYMVKSLALRERCIVVLTGVVDWISDGRTVVRLSNGHKLLEKITGSGCMVGTAVATFCGAVSMYAKSQCGDPRPNSLVDGDMLTAAIGGVLAITIASESAGVRSDVKGPGTFLPAFIDELSKLTPEILRERARIEVVR